MRLLLILLGVTLIACHDDHADCPTEAPQITSFGVTPETIAAGGDVTATVAVTNFEIGGESHTHSVPQHEDDEEVECAGGHVHVYLDDLMTEPLAMPSTTTFTLTIPDGTAVGEHTLIARLQNHDHTIVQPEVREEATITVE